MDNNEENKESQAEESAPAVETAEASAPEVPAHAAATVPAAPAALDPPAEAAAPAVEETPTAPEAPAATEAPAASTGGGGNPLQDCMEKIGLGELAQRDQYLLLGGALGALIALFLPWFTAGPFSVNSFHWWHGIVGLLSLVGAVGLIVMNIPWEWAAIAVGVLVGLLAIIATPGPDGIGTGIGVYLFLAGNVAIGVMCIDKAKIESIKVQLKIKK